MTKASKVPFSVTSAGATAATRYVGGTASGSPTGATFVTGDWAIAQNGAVWICTAGGTPGTWASPGAVTSVATRTGAVTLTAADIGAGTFPTGTFIYPSGSTVAVQGAPLDVSSASGTTAAAGSGIGDKISLYGASFGFGIQSNRLVTYVPSTASFAVRANSGSGNASSGTDVFTVSGTGRVDILGTTDPSLYLNDGTRSGRVAIASAAGDIFGGSAAGDMVLTSQTGKIYIPGTLGTLGSIAAISTVTGTNFAPSGLTGSQTATRWVGGTTAGAPTTGAHNLGDFVSSQDGTFYVCTTAGTPGTWATVSTGTTGPQGPPGGQELMVAESLAAYTVVTKDGTTWVDVPGVQGTIPAGQAFSLTLTGYLIVKLDTGSAIGDALVDVRVVDTGVTTNYGIDTHRFYVAASITGGTNAYNNRSLYCERRFAALASPVTVKMQIRCTANLSSTVQLVSSSALNYEPTAIICKAR